MKEKLSDLLKAVIFDLFNRDDLFLEIINKLVSIASSSCPEFL